MALKNKWFVLVFMAMFLPSCCGFYSFSGTSIPVDIKTISIDYFENEASIVSPLLSQNFTEMLKDKFISETNLDVVTTNGDYRISGKIVGYTIAPVAIQGNENATQSRLTIAVKAKLDCDKYPKQNFDQTFSKFTDFDANANFASIEESLNEEINTMIVQEIFNKTAINW
jgi:hypothetical protein